jgi:hypothetical protein
MQDALTILAYTLSPQIIGLSVILLALLFGVQP